MDKEFCENCLFRTRAHDSFKSGLIDNKGNAVLKTWEHCDHPDEDKPIDEVKSCPKDIVNGNIFQRELIYIEGLPFTKESAEKLLNLKDWEITYKIFPKQIIITGAIKKLTTKPKPPKPRIQSNTKQY